MDDSKVNRLMALYAAIIRGEKSEVKKLLTGKFSIINGRRKPYSTAQFYRCDTTQR